MKIKFKEFSKKKLVIFSILGILLIAGGFLLFTRILPVINFLNTSDNEPTQSENNEITIANPDTGETKTYEYNKDEALVLANTEQIIKTPSNKQQLVSPGSRNILIIGEDATAGGLFDTICIANIDEKSNVLKFIMIPRDLYVPYNDQMMNAIKKTGFSSSPGIYKINCAHKIGLMIGYKGNFNSPSINFVTEIIREMFDVKIDDYVRVNFDGFIEIVDKIGPVNVDIPYDIYQGNNVYIPKGVQSLDGKKALTFSRTRYVRDPATGKDINHGDIARKENQLMLLKNMATQYLTLGNINKIPDVMPTLSSNVKHSIKLGDVLVGYLGILRNMQSNKYKVETNVTNFARSGRISGSSYLFLE